MRRRAPKDVVKILLEVSKREFGPKSDGKRRKHHYRISRFHLLAASGRKRVDDQFFHELQDRLQNKGYYLIDLGDDFAIPEIGPMTRYRKLPEQIVAEYAELKRKKKERRLAKSRKSENLPSEDEEFDE